MHTSQHVREVNEEMNFTKRIMQKHGWKFMVIERSHTVPGKHSENKRAGQFYSQRENFLDSLKTDTRDGDKTPRREDVMMSAQKLKLQLSAHKDDPKTDRENLESSPDMIRLQQINENNTPIFLSPKKRTILRKLEPSGLSQEEVLNGTCVFAGNYTNGFKLQFSLSNHTYSSGIESMFQLAINSVASVLDSSDKIHNMQAYKELLHRKGLNMRFSWVLLARVKLQHSRDIILVSILCRTMRRILNEEAKIRQKQGFKRTKMFTMPNSVTGTVSVEKHEQKKSPLEVYKEILALYVNAVVKNKFAKYKLVFDETLLGLFLSRLKVLSLLSSLNLSPAEVNYIESKDVLDHIIELPSRNPILFLNSIQTYFGVQFKSEYLRLYRQDKYIVLNKN